MQQEMKIQHCYTTVFIIMINGQSPNSTPVLQRTLGAEYRSHLFFIQISVQKQLTPKLCVYFIRNQKHITVGPWYPWGIRFHVSPWMEFVEKGQGHGTIPQLLTLGPRWALWRPCQAHGPLHGPPDFLGTTESHFHFTSSTSCCIQEIPDARGGVAWSRPQT